MGSKYERKGPGEFCIRIVDPEGTWVECDWKGFSRVLPVRGYKEREGESNVDSIDARDWDWSGVG